MKQTGFFIALILACLFALPVDAQKQKKSKMPKADRAYNNAEYSKAIDLYKKAYTKKTKQVKAEAAYKCGECYRNISDYKEAANWYDKAIKGGYHDDAAILKLAEALKASGKYDEAIVQYNNYKAKHPDDSKVDAAIESSTRAQGWRDKPTRFKVNGFTAVNTKYYDFGSFLNPADKNTMYFTSSREESAGDDNDKWIGEKFFDLFKTVKDNNGKWSMPALVGTSINSDASDGSACIDSKGTTLYFSRVPKVKNKAYIGKIFKTTLNGTTWSDPEGITLNSEEYTVGQPALTADDQTMYFVSDMPGGLGGHDIWMSIYNKDNSSWGTPVNLGAAVNTPGDEMFPVVGPNGKLYFSSNGHSGMGGLDLFWTSNEGGSWSEPVNMQSPVNSAGDDFSMFWETATTGYLSSNREGGAGQDDIYTFEVPPPVFWIRGKVYDTDTKAPIAGAKVELFGSDGTNLNFVTGEDGTYRYDLKPETKYKVSASFTGYLTKFLEVSTVGIPEDKEFIGDFDFPLQSTEKPIPMPDIYYDLDKATLRPESKKELDKLIKVLDDNPTIVIKIMSHTDFRADDNYNQKLSERRAKSVVDYLIKSGVDKDRLMSQGMGEVNPRVIPPMPMAEQYAPFQAGDVLTEEYIKKLNKADFEKANQLNRWTEFKVERTDFVPKQ
jgi:peptidoglycan-associated lipoprotein